MSLAVESSGSLGACALEMFTYIAKALIQEMTDRCAGQLLGQRISWICSSVFKEAMSPLSSEHTASSRLTF